MLRIAIVEDDQEQVELLMAWLEAAGNSCVRYGSGEEFLRAHAYDSYDLIILDWMLPQMNGLDVLKHVRENTDAKVPILFVTQRDDERDVVAALEAGADDYMAKPVTEKETIARIGALARRAGLTDSEFDRFQDFAPYQVDFSSREVSLNGQTVGLTQKEYELAVFLFRNEGRIVSRGHILESVWGTSPDINTRTVDTHVSRLRNKLEIKPENGWKLTSVYQHGYRLEQVSTPA